MYQRAISLLMCSAVVSAVYAPPSYATPAPYAALASYVDPASAAYLAPSPKIAYAHNYAPTANAARLKYAAPPKYATPATYAPKASYDTEYDPNPSYSYAYDIQDHVTGDSKSQHESRQGDVVQGSYSLVEPDGSKRIVEYTADPHNGFNAVVHKEPGAYPAAKTYAAPAPVVKYAPEKYGLPADKYAVPAYAYAPAPATAIYAH